MTNCRLEWLGYVTRMHEQRVMKIFFVGLIIVTHNVAQGRDGRMLWRDMKVLKIFEGSWYEDARSRSASYDLYVTCLCQQQLQQQSDRTCGKKKDVSCVTCGR